MICVWDIWVVYYIPAVCRFWWASGLGSLRVFSLCLRENRLILDLFFSFLSRWEGGPDEPRLLLWQPEREVQQQQRLRERCRRSRGAEHPLRSAWTQGEPREAGVRAGACRSQEEELRHGQRTSSGLVAGEEVLQFSVWEGNGWVSSQQRLHRQVEHHCVSDMSWRGCDVPLPINLMVIGVTLFCWLWCETFCAYIIFVSAPQCGRGWSKWDWDVCPVKRSRPRWSWWGRTHCRLCRPGQRQHWRRVLGWPRLGSWVLCL